MTMCKRCGALLDGNFGDRKKDYVTCQDCIVEIARASGTDEANRNMKRNKREKWNQEDYTIAGNTFHIVVRALNA